MWPRPPFGMPPQRPGFFPPPFQQHMAPQVQLRPPMHMMYPPPHRPQQADPWRKVFTPEGKEYYHNTMTNETSWTKPGSSVAPATPSTVIPTPPQKPAEPKPKPVVWKEFKTEEGRSYFYNTETQQTSWERPMELELSTKKEQEEPQQQETAQDTQQQKQQEGEVKNEVSQIESESAKEKELSPEEAETIFIACLNDKDVSPDWKWDNVMRFLINEPRFSVIKRVSERKKVWNRWKPLRRKQVEDEVRRKYQQVRTDVKEMMRKEPYVFEPNTFDDVEFLLATHPELHAVKSVSERRTIFRTVKEEKEDALREELDAGDAAIREDFKTILDNIPDLEPTWTWAKLIEYLDGVEVYRSDERFEINPFACLDVYREYVRGFDAKMKAIEAEKKLEDKFEEMVERENFLKLLDELEENGKLHSEALWRTLFPEISQDERYITLLGNPGSSALELFMLRMEELKNRVFKERNHVRTLFEKKGFEVKTTTTAEEFLNALHGCEGVDGISAINMKFIFEDLHRSAEHAELKAKKIEMRANRENLLNIILDNEEKWTKEITAVDLDAAMADVEGYADARAALDEANFERVHAKFLSTIKKKEEKKKKKEEEERMEKERMEREQQEEQERRQKEKEKEENDQQELRRKSSHRHHSESSDSEDEHKRKKRKHKQKKRKHHKHRSRKHEEDSDLEDSYEKRHRRRSRKGRSQSRSRSYSGSRSRSRSGSESGK
eukprot:m.44195 g.44195  ORF g.44195 m.44195 type:complete len:723 (-) comp7156_c0_seq1:94-2262(-)